MENRASKSRQLPHRWALLNLSLRYHREQLLKVVLWPLWSCLSHGLFHAWTIKRKLCHVSTSLRGRAPCLQVQNNCNKNNGTVTGTGRGTGSRRMGACDQRVEVYVMYEKPNVSQENWDWLWKSERISESGRSSQGKQELGAASVAEKESTVQKKRGPCPLLPSRMPSQLAGSSKGCGSSKAALSFLVLLLAQKARGPEKSTATKATPVHCLILKNREMQDKKWAE